jgi:uncharacterized protein (DUF1697 family)
VTRVAALLQGVNLAGNRRVSMPELRERLEAVGYEDVGTYVASGNVVLSSSVAPAELERQLTQQISEWLGVGIPVLVRTHADLVDVVERDPLGRFVENPARYQVSFLSEPPASEVVRELGQAEVEPERVAVEGREIYAGHPNGVGRSKLASLLTAKRLGVVVTARNWNTVVKLVELTRETGS